MAPSRGKGKGRATPNRNKTSTPNGRSTRSAGQPRENDVPDVYHDLLAEAAATEHTDDAASDRPLKKRRIAVKASSSKEPSPGNGIVGGQAQHGEMAIQTVQDSGDDDDDDESDFAFEDVDLDQDPASRTEAGQDKDIADISVSVDPSLTPKGRAQARRKPASVAEKAFRVIVHKMHVLYLLAHCMTINRWCNNVVVHRHLRPLLSKKAISYLNPKAEDSQFQRDRSFMEGLRHVSETFRGRFTVSGSGMRRAQWNEDDEEDRATDNDTNPMDRSDFIEAAREMEGSQDTGNQLFCALLRAVGVEARVVCSLQPLPFTASTSGKSTTPKKPAKPTVFAMASTMRSPNPTNNTPEDDSTQSSSRIGAVPSTRRRLGQPTFGQEPLSTSTSPRKKMPIRKLSHPIFWTEAFNTAHQKWISVDPLVTQTVARPSKLEPAASYPHNQMSYVVGFETSGVARDVTRRYVRAFNAKTRRQRVESTEGGALWWKKALRPFRRRGGGKDADGIEDGELSQREAKESLPTNVQDFKDHPYYALERHLKRQEVIYPRRELGKVNAGTSAKPRMEAVFRRSDVQVCKSAEKWFRVGRVVQEGEQPFKRVPARTPRKHDEDNEEGPPLTPLYALYQTEIYTPPPVQSGRVPRNAYGNLDLYVPSMVPAGGTHIRHSLARSAAKILNIDIADAVTGFTFKGRQGTAVIEGGVVATEFAGAMEAVIESLEDERVEEESRARSAVALGVWRRFLVGLRIQERVKTYGEPASGDDVRDQIDREVEGENVGEAGGFLPAEAEEEALPTAGRFSLVELSAPSTKTRPVKKKRDIESEEEEEAEFTESELSAREEHPTLRPRRGERGSVFKEDFGRNSTPEDPASLTDHDGGGSGGGFLPEDTNMDVDEGRNVGSGGGFLPEPTETNPEGAASDNNDASDGGFLPEDAVMADDEGSGGFIPDDEAGGFEREDDGMADDEGGGFIVDDEAGWGDDSAMPADDTAMTDQNVESQRDDIRIDVESEPSRPQANFLREVQDEPAPATVREVSEQGPSTVPAPAFTQAENNDGSDRDSMLSHDPEDEDAEPDWLESD